VVSSFAGITADGVLALRGRPVCQSGHDALLKWLTDNATPFLAPADARRDNNILRGNLGETIAFCVSYWRDCQNYRVFATNALRPFRPKSDIDIDIVWLSFGVNPSDDFAIIQEVKTTSGTELSYARALVDDYDKLFGTNIRLTLHTRLQDIKIDFSSRSAGRWGRTWHSGFRIWPDSARGRRPNSSCGPPWSTSWWGRCRGRK
jgi:hypothetical protein